MPSDAAFKVLLRHVGKCIMNLSCMLFELCLNCAPEFPTLFHKPLCQNCSNCPLILIILSSAPGRVPFPLKSLPSAYGYLLSANLGSVSSISEQYKQQMSQHVLHIFVHFCTRSTRGQLQQQQVCNVGRDGQSWQCGSLTLSLYMHFLTSPYIRCLNEDQGWSHLPPLC